LCQDVHPPIRVLTAENLRKLSSDLLSEDKVILVLPERINHGRLRLERNNWNSSGGFRLCFVFRCDQVKQCSTVVADAEGAVVARRLIRVPAPNLRSVFVLVNVECFHYPSSPSALSSASFSDIIRSTASESMSR